MSITRRVIFFGLALVPLVLLAACGDDDDDSGEAFQLPPAGEYSFEVTGTMEIEIVPEEVSAAPRARGQPETSDVSGDLTIQLGEDGGFTISDKDGATLFAVTPQGDSITFTQNEAIPSTGTISGDGVEVELNLAAELFGADGPVTTTSEEPIRLEGEGNPISDEGVILSTPADAEPVNFVSADGVTAMIFHDIPGLFIGLFGGYGLVTPAPDESTPSPTSGTASDPDEISFDDPTDDATDCTTGESVVDPAVEISGVVLTKDGESIVVEVVTVQSPETSFLDFSAAVLVFLGDLDALAQMHAGQLDEVGNVTWTDGGVSFLFPDASSVSKGDPLRVETFHLETADSTRNCDTLDAVYSCFGRCDD